VTKRILLLGATGRTGGLILDYALSKNLEVVVLARRQDAIRIRSDQLTVINGSPLNLDEVRKSMIGCDAVISALNNNRASDMPWAKPLSPTHLLADSIKNCVIAMKENDVRRIAVLSASGAGESAKYLPFLMRWIVTHTNLAISHRDHDAQEAVLQASGLDWTAARAVALSNNDKHKLLVTSYKNDPKPAWFISRGNVARFLVDCLDQPKFFGKTPVVSER